MKDMSLYRWQKYLLIFALLLSHDFLARCAYAVVIPVSQEIKIDLTDNHSHLDDVIDRHKETKNTLIDGDGVVRAKSILDEQVEARPLLGFDFTEYQVNEIADDSVKGLKSLLRDYMHDKDISYSSTLFSLDEMVSASPDISSKTSADAAHLTADQLMTQSITAKNYASQGVATNAVVVNKKTPMQTGTSTVNATHEPVQKLSTRELMLVLFYDLLRSPYLYLVLLILLVFWLLSFFRHMVFSGRTRSRSRMPGKRRRKTRHYSRSIRRKFHRKSLADL
jgi:hypothetical protein